MLLRRVSRRLIFLLGGAALAAAATIAAGWRLGQRHQTPQQWTHRVSGGSMCPTLWGEHYVLNCPNCNIVLRVDASPTSTLFQSTATKLKCWHCGEFYKRPSGPAAAGNLIVIDPEKSPKRSELVALHREGQLSVKRIFGLPGDMVDVAIDENTPGRLTCNSQLLPTDATMIPIDRDALRDPSRWQGGSAWSRTERSWKIQLTSNDDVALSSAGVYESGQNFAGRNVGEEAWLRYHHRSVHDGNQPSAIFDDCPSNPILVRAMYPVSQAIVSMQVTCSAPIKLYAASLTETELLLGTHELAIPMAADDIAIAVSAIVVAANGESVEVTIRNLAIDRAIEYRLRPGDETACYPIQLAEDEYFVLGDNVPISIDSRDYGPISGEDIVGVVTLIRE